MSSRRQVDRPFSLLSTITVSIGLAALPIAAESIQPLASVTPITSLEFDDASGALWKATPRSLARSLDGGQTWIPIVLPAAAQGHMASLTISAGRAKTIYVAVVGSGVLHSHDGGRTWLVRNQGLPNSNVVALAAHSTEPRTVYAYVVGKGIFRSHDSGASWHFADRGPREPVVQLVHSNVAGAGWLFAATHKGVRRTMDGFRGWHSAGEVRLGFRVVTSDADWPARIYAAAPEGLFISPDSGDHWIRMRSPSAAITALVSTPSGRLYGAINGKLISSGDRGVTWNYIAK